MTSQVAAVAFDGTSSTSLLVDSTTGRVLAAPKLYDEAQGPEAVQAAKVGREDKAGSYRLPWELGGLQFCKWLCCLYIF